MLPDVKYAFIADTHIENNRNLPFVMSTFEWITKTLLEKKIDYLFILGDFVNSRFKFDILALNKAIEVLNAFQKNNLKVFLLLGNHERYYKSTDFSVTSIKPFEKHCIILNKVRTIIGDGFAFHIVPNVETIVEFNEIVSKIELNPKKYNILLAHTDIKGATTNDLYNIVSKEGISPDVLHRFDRVFLGHYHARQEIKNIIYVGSPVQLTHGEEFSVKGITIWDAKDNSIEFIENPNYEVYKTVLDIDEDVRNKFVRYFTNQFLDATDAKKIKELLIANGALDVKIEIKNKEFKEISQSELENFDLKDTINKYIELNSSNLDKEQLFKMCKEIMNDI